MLHGRTRAVVDVMDGDPVRVTPMTDVVDVTLLMADYNLMTVPVVDADDRLLGVITVDDVLEATIPDDWRRREPPARPEGASIDIEETGTTHDKPRTSEVADDGRYSHHGSSEAAKSPRPDDSPPRQLPTQLFRCAR